ncbi:MAG TPA: M48 family metallopeptidase [Luteibaculaceae bacterium]|nr:M48 family metallopeptidase [Luteibaculaceae bacterium]
MNTVIFDSSSGDKIKLLDDPLVHVVCVEGEIERVKSLIQNKSSGGLFLSLNARHGLLAGILVLVLAAFPAGYFWGIPWLSEVVVEQLPVRYDRDWGKTMSQVVVEENTILTAESKAVTEFFKGFKNDQAPFEVDIKVIESDELNAFALPGGYIFVYSALLDSCKTVEELAALLGHESGHTFMRHSTKAISRALIGQAMLSLVLGSYEGLGDAALSRVNSIKELVYSRSLETEADGHAVNFLESNGYSRAGLIKLFKTLQKAEKENNSDMVPSFLRTHPMTQDRIQFVKSYRGQKANSLREKSIHQSHFEKIKSLRSSGF